MFFSFTNILNTYPTLLRVNFPILFLQFLIVTASFKKIQIYVFIIIEWTKINKFTKKLFILLFLLFPRNIVQYRFGSNSTAYIFRMVGWFYYVKIIKLTVGLKKVFFIKYFRKEMFENHLKYTIHFLQNITRVCIVFTAYNLRNIIAARRAVEIGSVNTLI